MDTALLVAVMLPATVTLLLPLVSVKPPGAVIALSWAMLLACVPRFNELAAPVRLAVNCPAVTTPDWVTAPVALKSSVPVPTLELLEPTPMLMAPVRTNALALALVFTLRLVAAMSMPSAALEPIVPLFALSVTFVAVMVFTPVSVIEPAFSVTLLPVRLTAAPMVSTPVLAASPITIGPVAPVEMAVISAAERSKAEEPANDIAWPAVLGLSVSVPDVVSALLPALAAMATVSATTVMLPDPAEISILVFWV